VLDPIVGSVPEPYRLRVVEDFGSVCGLRCFVEVKSG
jgi:hypothetical protein